MRYITKTISFLFIFLLFPFMVFAEDQPDPRLITVFGEAEVRVTPDEIILRLGVETLNKDLSVAKKENDKRTKNIIDVAKKNKVEEKHIQTDFIRIDPKYEDRYEREEFIGYLVRQSILLEIRDTSKFEDIFSEVLWAGANYVHDVNFRTTELQKYRDQARSLAIKAALEKANKLAKELGQKVGKPYMIQEDGTQGGAWWNPESLSGPQMVHYNDAGLSGSDGSIALGQIKISAKIIVSFELE